MNKKLLFSLFLSVSLQNITSDNGAQKPNPQQKACFSDLPNEIKRNIVSFLSKEADYALSQIDAWHHEEFNQKYRFDKAQYVGQPQILSGHTDFVLCLETLPDGRIVSGSRDNTVRVWDPNRPKNHPKHVQILRGHNGWILDLKVLPNESIVSGSCDGTVRVWNPNKPEDDPEYVRILQGHTNWVHYLAILQDERIVSAADDHTIRIWDISRLRNHPEYVRVLTGHTGPITCLALLQNRHIVSGSRDRTVRVWNPDNSEQMHVLEGHSWPISSVSTLPNGRIISGDGYNGQIRIWDPDKPEGDPERIQVLHQHSRFIECLLPLSDEKFISGSSDHNMIIWDLSNPKTYRAQYLFGHSNQVWRMLPLSNGKIASGSRDNTVRIWNPNGSNNDYLSVRTLQGHTAPIADLVTLPQDKRLVSGSYDHTIRIWPSKEYFENKAQRTDTFSDYADDGIQAYAALFSKDNDAILHKLYLANNNSNIKSVAQVLLENNFYLRTTGYLFWKKNHLHLRKNRKKTITRNIILALSLKDPTLNIHAFNISKTAQQWVSLLEKIGDTHYSMHSELARALAKRGKKPKNSLGALKTSDTNGGNSKKSK